MYDLKERLVLSLKDLDKIKRGIATTIKFWIFQNDLTMKQFGELLGQSPSAVSRWLSGKHNFTVNTLIAIGKVLDFPWFVFEERQIETMKNKTKSMLQTRIEEVERERAEIKEKKRIFIAEMEM